MWFTKTVSYKLKYIFQLNEVISAQHSWHWPKYSVTVKKPPPPAQHLGLLVESLCLSLSCPRHITLPRGQVTHNLGFKGLPYVEREYKRGNSVTTIQ